MQPDTATPNTTPVGDPDQIVTVTVYLPRSLKKRARMAAGGDDVSLSFWAADAFLRKLEADR